MIETTEFLSETQRISGDVLSDLLSTMHLAGTVLFRGEFSEPWSVDTPESGQLCQMLPFRTEHVIPFHIIGSGGCWLDIPEERRLWLGEGDAVILPYGDGHCLSRGEAPESVQVSRLLPQTPWNDIPVIEYGGAGPRTSIICGFLQCDELLFHPILQHLPVLLHVSSAMEPGDQWLSTTIRHTVTEASKPLPGSRDMLPRLTELMFVEILRKHMQELSADEVGWFAAINDPFTGTALKYMHAAPFQDWSVDRLARLVGVSRTILTEHFKHFLDKPPMQYLKHWRLQLAAQNLKSSDFPIKVIADQTGYESEAAFNRAFKRHFGLPPGNWRRKQSKNTMNS